MLGQAFWADDKDFFQLVCRNFPDAIVHSSLIANAAYASARDQRTIIFYDLLESLRPSQWSATGQLIHTMVCDLVHNCGLLPLANRRSSCAPLDWLLAYLARHNLAHGREVKRERADLVWNDAARVSQ
jgi:hypothetical protein